MAENIMVTPIEPTQTQGNPQQPVVQVVAPAVPQGVPPTTPAEVESENKLLYKYIFFTIWLIILLVLVLVRAFGGIRRISETTLPLPSDEPGINTLPTTIPTETPINTVPSDTFTPPPSTPFTDTNTTP